MPTKSNNSLTLFLLLVGGILAVYANTFHVPFLFDDKASIIDNPNIRSFWPISFNKLFAFEPFSPISGRPVVMLSFALNYALSGLHVWSYHVFNAMLHVINALLLYGIVRRTLLVSGLIIDSPLSATRVSFLIALIWAIHPLLTESVTYITQRTELLMALFTFFLLYCAIRGRTANRPLGWDLTAIASCAFGMGSKESMVSAPFLVFCYDWVVDRRGFRNIWEHRRTLYVGLISTWLLVIVRIAYGMRSSATEFFNTFFGQPHLNPWQYALTQCGVILYYLRLAIWPHPLTLDYSDWPIANSVVDVWLSMSILLVLLVVATWLWYRKSWMGFLGLFFFLTLAPTSSVVVIVTEIAAERRMYLPLAAVITACATAGWRLTRSRPFLASLGQKSLKWILSMLVLLLGILTIQRNATYQNEVSIWVDSVKNRPRNARARNNLGLALDKAGKDEEARLQYVEALQLKPDFIEALFNLGLVLDQQGKLDQALNCYLEVLRLYPVFGPAENEIGTILLRQNRLHEAYHHLSRAFELMPQSSIVHNNLGLVLARQGRLEEAVAHYAESMHLAPHNAIVHNEIGVILAMLGRLSEAIEHFREALRLSPKYQQAKTNLELALSEENLR